MKKDTSKIVDLDELFAKKEVDSSPKELISESVKPAATKPLPNLDAILEEWSWRCDKGYPDFNNLSDRFALQEVLDEMNIELPFERILKEDIATPVVKKSTKVATIKEDDKLAKQAKKAASELDKLISTIPTMPISEKWGIMGSDERKEFDSRLKVLVKGAGSDPVKRLATFISNINGSTKTTKSSKISDIFNRLVLLRTINNIVTGFSPSGAGFIFEALTAAIMGGEQQTEKDEFGQLGIADVDVNGQPYSMKLLSGKTPKLKGSLTNLVKDVNDGKVVTYIIMKRESTTGGKIEFYSGLVTKSNIAKFKSNASGQAKNKKDGKLITNPQFILSSGSWKDIFEDYKLIGVLDVNAETIRGIVQDSLVDLQQKVEPIYASLKDFTINLHTYFGTNKDAERKEAVVKAKQSANELDSKTQQLT